MKKVLYLIMILSALVLVPISVKADMGAPGILTYEARVTNKSGATIYDASNNMKKTGTLKYDEIVEISYEFTYRGENYGEIEDGAVKLSDVKPVKSELSFESWKEEKEEDYENFDEYFSDIKKLYVFREGAYLYKGPSAAYDKVDNTMIPIGETIEYQYFDEAWAYVTYKGKTGWIYTYSIEDMDLYNFQTAVVDLEEKPYKVVAFEDMVLYDEQLKDKTKTKVPALTEVEVTAYLGIEASSGYCLVTYKNQKGWMECGDGFTSYVSSHPNYIYALEDLVIYETPKNSSKKIDTIKKGKEAKVIYKVYTGMFTSKMYVEYNGKKGFVIDDDDFDDDDNLIETYVESTSYDKYIFHESEPLKFYDEIGGKTNGKTLDAKGEIVVRYEYQVESSTNEDEYDTWVYIEDYGWAKISNPDDIEYVEYEEEETPVEPIPADKDKDKEKDKKKNDTLPSEVIYYALGAVVLCLVALVTVKLVNKKKKKTEAEAPAIEIQDAAPTPVEKTEVSTENNNDQNNI